MKKLITLLVLSVAALSAQVADPPYDQPGAQENAEMRFALNYIFLGGGYMPPPVGWSCEIWWDSIGAAMIPAVHAYCEPDPAVLAEQEREQNEWIMRQIENGKRLFGRRR